MLAGLGLHAFETLRSGRREVTLVKHVAPRHHDHFCGKLRVVGHDLGGGYDDGFPAAFETFDDLDGDGRDELITVTFDFSLFHNLSLFLVEGNTPGFIRSRKLEKMGMESQDTAELAFDECRIPADNLLGQEGGGFMMLMQKLQQEQLCVAIMSQANVEQVLEDAISYTKERKAFGRSISKFQNTQFTLAECATEVEVGRAFLDRLIGEHVAGKYLVKECSMAKLYATEMASRVADRAVQVFGGYGYMKDYPVEKLMRDAKLLQIYEGTNQIQRMVIGRHELKD